MWKPVIQLISTDACHGVNKMQMPLFLCLPLEYYIYCIADCIAVDVFEILSIQESRENARDEMDGFRHPSWH